MSNADILEAVVCPECGYEAERIVLDAEWFEPADDCLECGAEVEVDD